MARAIFFPLSFLNGYEVTEPCRIVSAGNLWRLYEIWFIRRSYRTDINAPSTSTGGPSPNSSLLPGPEIDHDTVNLAIRTEHKGAVAKGTQG